MSTSCGLDSQRALAAGVEFGRKRGCSYAQAEHIAERLGQGLSPRQVAARMGMAATHGAEGS